MLPIHTFCQDLHVNFKCSSGKGLKMKIISLFSLLLLLFMDFTVLFGTAHRYYCIISTNFYLYLQYFQ